MKKKVLTIIMAAVLIIGCSVAGTLAWLTSTTDTKVNTFTLGKVEIDLDEDTGETYKMVPGVSIKKDPYVTVKSGSEACWVFVEIDEVNNTFTFNDSTQKFITYTMNNEWTELKDGVYYRKVDSEDKDQTFYLFGEDAEHSFVNVNENITKEDLNELDTNAYPQLKITAYAIQSAGFDNAEDAWNELGK